MQGLKFLFRQFLRESLWFKILIISSLVITIVFSSSFITDSPYLQSGAKLAAVVIFAAYGIKFRGSLKTSVPLFAAACICLYLAWHILEPALS